MQFVSKKPLVFISRREVTSKAGKSLIFVKLADPSTYENVDFLLGEGADFKGCAAGEVVTAVLNVDGRFLTVTKGE